MISRQFRPAGIEANHYIVSEVIALKIRRPNSTHPYLYPQIFAGLAYFVATGAILALWLIQRKKKAKMLAI